MLALQEMESKFPALRPLIDQYYPAMVAMGEAAVMDWLNRAMLSGDEYAATAELLARLPKEQADQWPGLLDRWTDKAHRNSANMQWQRDIANGFMRGLVMVAFAAVGL